MNGFFHLFVFFISFKTISNSYGDIRLSRTALETKSLTLLILDRANTRISSCFLAFVKSFLDMYFPIISVRPQAKAAPSSKTTMGAAIIIVESRKSSQYIM